MLLIVTSQRSGFFAQIALLFAILAVMGELAGAVLGWAEAKAGAKGAREHRRAGESAGNANRQDGVMRAAHQQVGGFLQPGALHVVVERFSGKAFEQAVKVERREPGHLRKRFERQRRIDVGVDIVDHPVQPGGIFRVRSVHTGI